MHMMAERLDKIKQINLLIFSIVNISLIFSIKQSIKILYLYQASFEKFNL